MGGRTHGMSGSVEHQTWRRMLQRCRNQNRPEWKDYGGRGIAVCERWLKFENFFADMGERPPKRSLDRYPNNDGNYEPGNARWATAKEQANNRRKHTGQAIDLTGQVFGSLTVLERAPNKGRHVRWLCRCVCGTERPFKSRDLRSGETKSCGCVNHRKLIDLTGQVFDELTVLKQAPSRSGEVYWLCKCSCGSETAMRSDKLRAGLRHSCGCVAPMKQAAKRLTKRLDGSPIVFLYGLPPLIPHDCMPTRWPVNTDTALLLAQKVAAQVRG